MENEKIKELEKRIEELENKVLKLEEKIEDLDDACYENEFAINMAAQKNPNLFR